MATAKKTPAPQKPVAKAPVALPAEVVAAAHIAAPAAKAPSQPKAAATPKLPKPPKVAKAIKAAKPAKTATPAPAKATVKAAVKADKAPKKPKLVRDSFTIPKNEYSVLDELKQRAAKAGAPAKKSEVLRAGIKALAAMSDAAFLAAVNAVPAIKTGRPAKD